MLLQQAVDLEPIGTTTVARAALGHAHVVALAQATRLAGGAILFVNDALALVLALTDCADVVVRATKEGLWRRVSRREGKELDKGKDSKGQRGGVWWELALCTATYLAALACESAKVKTRCRLAAYFARLIHL